MSIFNNCVHLTFSIIAQWKNINFFRTKKWLLGFEPTSFRFKVQIPSFSFSCPNQDLNPHPSGSNLKVLGSNPVIKSRCGQKMVLSTPGFEPSPLKEVIWGSRFKSRYDLFTPGFEPTPLKYQLIGLRFKSPCSWKSVVQTRIRTHTL